ncbi:nucleotidyltransferase family protein [Isoptericola aurantiacus]|uniref:nucleotidyltransferase family protein n=1 Tax=Isoptericola aurantiacus TaxID=3377839 RepID=UPI00383A5EF0
MSDHDPSGPGRRQVRRILLDAVRGDREGGTADVEGLDLALLGESAREHRIRPAVHRYLAATAEIPSVTAAARRQSMRHLLLLAGLREVGGHLDDAGVRWAVGKGPVAAGHLWPSAAMREYTDLDLYIAPQDFPTAVEALLDSGCVLVDRNWPALLRSGRGELAMRAPRGQMLDLHWSVAVRPELRRAFRIDLDAMLAARRTVEIGGIDVPTFDPVDGALLLAFHACQEGANRLLWLGDVWHAAREPGFDWSELEDRARSFDVYAPVMQVCARVDRVLGLGEHGRRAVQGLTGFWPWIVRQRERRLPGVLLPGDRHGDGRLIAATRNGPLSSLAVAVGSGLEVRRIQRRVARNGPEGNVLDLDVPDDDARSAYLELAARGAVRRP